MLIIVKFNGNNVQQENFLDNTEVIPPKKSAIDK